MAYNKKNLANSTLSAGIASGATSIIVQTGEGANFPATPFYATLTPYGVLSQLSNSEIVLVTAISTDTLTVTRAQRSTTAKAFITGDIIANGIYTEDLTSLTSDDIADGTTNKQYTATEKTKLSAITGTNTGDETTATIKSKLSITTLSGSNTGDQTTVTGNAGTATALQTARTIDGVSFNGTANITVIAPATHAATAKTTIVDADETNLADSAASWVLKKTTFANIWSWILAKTSISGAAWLDAAISTATDKAISSNAVKSYVDQSSPTGVILPYVGRVAPTGWLLCYGQEVSRSTYSTLFNIISPSLGAFTTTIASPGVATLTAHGLRTGDQVYATTTGALPTGLTANTIYYVNVIDANTFRFCTTHANAFSATFINTTGTQSGTHTLVYAPYGLGNGSTTFNVPDLRGYVVAGKDDMGGSAANRLNLLTAAGLRGYNLGNTGGSQGHTLNTTEIPSHYHTTLDPTNSSLPGFDGNLVIGGSTGSVASLAQTGGAFRVSGGGNTGNVGGGATHNNVQPTIIANQIIKY